MTDLLRDNDPGGGHAPSWYAATAGEMPVCPPLDGDTVADVCIVGGGYTGLAAALELSGQGLDVILLEANRVGWGASGRNGGQVGTGVRAGQAALAKEIGDGPAREVWAITEEAKASVRGYIERFGIDCDYRPGIIYAERFAGDVQELHKEADYLADTLGYAQTTKLDKAALEARLAARVYAGGAIDHGAAQVHPLNYALGLARAAQAAGVRICEGTRVTALGDGQVVTERGTVRAAHVLVGANGYLGDLDRPAAAAIMPINSFIVATEPLEDPEALIADRMAVSDSNFVVNYYRVAQDNRLLFGGAETYGYRFPKDIAPRVRRNLKWVFPQLKETRIDYAWGGTLAITVNRLPYVRAEGGRIVAGGYSGHGVAMATMMGRLMGRAVLGEAQGLKTMELLRPGAFPGGTRLRHPLLFLAMSWYAMRDRLGM